MANCSLCIMSISPYPSRGGRRKSVSMYKCETVQGIPECVFWTVEPIRLWTRFIEDRKIGKKLIINKVVSIEVQTVLPYHQSHSSDNFHEKGTQDG